MKTQLAALFSLSVVTTSAVSHAQVTTIVSVDNLGAQGTGTSGNARWAGTTNQMVFDSSSPDLVAGDANRTYDVFLSDIAAPSCTLISVNTSGAPGNGDSRRPFTDDTASAIVFESSADDLVAGDTNGYYDVFVHRPSTGLTQRVQPAATETNGPSSPAGLSSSGQWLVFDSTASNWLSGDTNLARDVFLYDLNASAVQVVSRTPAAEGNGASFADDISQDGAFVVFTSRASNLVANDSLGVADVFLWQRATGTIQLVSAPTPSTFGNGNSSAGSVSANGDFVAFVSHSTNLVAADTNGKPDIFVWTRASGVVTRVSVSVSGAQSSERSAMPSISPDGAWVAFSALGPLKHGDGNSNWDVYARQVASAGSLLRVSLTATGTSETEISWSPRIRTLPSSQVQVLFESRSEVLVSPDNVADDLELFLWTL